MSVHFPPGSESDPERWRQARYRFDFLRFSMATTQNDGATVEFESVADCLNLLDGLDWKE